MKKGYCLLTFDTELAWGTRGAVALRNDYEGTRVVIEEALRLLEKYSIKTTWAIVGHLFLRACEKHGDCTHADVQGDGACDPWLASDPGTDVERDSLWYGPDIVDAILQSSVRHEIGCHSFSHLPADHELCTPERFRNELAKCKALAQERGVALGSFVYPENRIAKTELLSGAGFRAYRGVDTNWYRQTRGIVRKISHVIDQYLVPGSPAVSAKTDGGILNIPGSLYYPHKRSWARALPVARRVQKARLGLESAAKHGRVFHLWTHPFNLASDPDGLLNGLDKILQTMRAMIDHGELANATMSEYAELYHKGQL